MGFFIISILLTTHIHIRLELKFHRLVVLGHSITIVGIYMSQIRVLSYIKLLLYGLISLRAIIWHWKTFRAIMTFIEKHNLLKTPEGMKCPPSFVSNFWSAVLTFRVFVYEQHYGTMSGDLCTLYSCFRFLLLTNLHVLDHYYISRTAYSVSII